MVRDTLSARLIATETLSEDTSSFTFAAVDAPFPQCGAGSHVDLHLPNGMVRNYSLIDWDAEGRRLSIGVKSEPEGRGGSLAVHALELGCLIKISTPRNNFPLRIRDAPIVLLGGGIGITPLFAMARELRSAGRSFDLHYLVRTRSVAAFDAPLRALELGASYHLHCDDTDGLLDFVDLVASHPADARYYVCGPEVMLQALQSVSDELKRGTVYFERFAGVSPAANPADKPDHPFRVALASTGEELEVPADKSVLDVLRDAGHDVDYACSEGACGTCVTDVLEGVVDHRDSVLTAEERVAGDCMCICVSRVRGARLVLDL